MRWILFLFLAFVFASDASTWTLNRTALEERLSSEVTIEELVSVLKMEGIDVCFKTRSDLMLWKGKKVSISLSPAPFAPYHLWVAVEGRKTLDACTADELAEVYEAIWKGRKALAETTGAESFMIFTTEGTRNGKGSSSFGVEIIPSNNRGVMDAVEKNALNDYVFYNLFSTRNVVESPATIHALREKLHALQPSLEAEAPQERWSQKLLRHEEALHQHLQSLHDILAQMGALVEGEMLPLPETEEGVHETQIDLDRCAFCKPKVIEKQIVCDWKEIQILMSHKPFSPSGNFLILPSRHQCAWDLTREEAIASFEAIIALKKTFLETVGSNDWICYIQDGPAVGQTVPHTHIHFFLLPDPLKAVLSGIQHIHNKRPILTYEEMRAACEKIKPLLLDRLESR